MAPAWVLPCPDLTPRQVLTPARVLHLRLRAALGCRVRPLPSSIRLSRGLWAPGSRPVSVPESVDQLWDSGGSLHVGACVLLALQALMA